jgi:hypothetical protein
MAPKISPEVAAENESGKLKEETLSETAEKTQKKQKFLKNQRMLVGLASLGLGTLG